MNEIPLWCLTAIALIGTVMNVKKQRMGFLLWIVSNLGFCCANIIFEHYSMAFLFSVYFFLSIWGWMAWKPQEEVPCPSTSTAYDS